MTDEIPIVCDMSGAPDTPAERLAEYGRLFAEALASRERTPDGIRFRFRAQPGVDEWVRDLARREQACCAFFRFDVTSRDDEVWWDASVVDDDAARQVLDELYRLPDMLTGDASPSPAGFFRPAEEVVDDDRVAAVGDDRPRVGAEALVDIAGGDAELQQ